MNVLYYLTDPTSAKHRETRGFYDADTNENSQRLKDLDMLCSMVQQQEQLETV